MAKFNISDNRLCAPGTKTLAEALKGNQIMTELNISSNGMGWDDRYNEGSDMSGVEALASAIPTMGALTSLNLAKNYLKAEGAEYVAEAIKVNVSALRFDWHHFGLDLTAGSTAAVVYGYCYYNTTKGALTSLDLSRNHILAEEMESIQRVCGSMQITLKN